jgi:pimeloyl-ACP methyl ester carboxylesterase
VIKIAAMDVWFEGEMGGLRGTIELATDRGCSGSALVLIHGSGPGTRGDAEELVLRLSAAGVASLRYDKPGCGESEGDWRLQNFEDRAHEALAALDALTKAVPDVRCAGLAGGSQGGWIVLRAAALSKRVRFAICYSAAGVSPGEQETYRLAHQLPEEGHSRSETEEALRLLRERLVRNRAGVPVDEIHERERRFHAEGWFPLLGGADREELRFDLAIYDYDPWPSLVGARCPVLAVWGESDVIVPVEQSVKVFREAARVANRGDDDLLVVPQVGHGLRTAQGRIAPAVIEKTISWLREVCGK